MEAETTEKSEPCRDEFMTVLNTCAQCKESYQNRDPKLLTCLHTVCGECLPNLTTAGENCVQVIKCPTCGLECSPSAVIGNLFANVVPTSPTTNSKNAESDESKICTGCEENMSATSYCLECTEYLCDQCVQAHRRVRITKDHTIQPKDNVSQENALNIGERTMLCPVHKQEPLKLYCETCEKLTCRDCQLLGHKDHKYQFVDEAAENYKKFLLSLLEKIREKKIYVENAKTLIEKRHEEITQKEQKVASDVRTFIMKVAQELNKRGKQLMVDLQNICKAKKGQLDKKNKEVCGLSKTLDHALKFAEFSLEKGNNAALMYTKKSLNYQLKNVLKIRCEVPNPYHVIDMKFGYDPKTPLIQIPTLGSIFVDGVPFNPSQSNSSSCIQEKPSCSANQPHSSQSQSHSNPNLGQMKAPSSASSSERPNSENLHNLSNQQKAMLMSKMKKMQEQQQQQQQQQQHQQRHPSSGYHPNQQMYNRQGHHPTSPSSSSTGLQGLHMMTQMQQPMVGSSQHLSHLPHQSSCISSSNGLNLRGPAYYPPPLKGPHPIQQHQPQRRPPDPLTESLIQINLSQLQERRNQHNHMAHHQQAQYVAAHQARNNMYPPPPLQPPTTTNNMQNPIVIQPTPDYSDMINDSALDALLGISSTSPGRSTFPSSHLSDCMHNSQPTPKESSTNRGMKPEEVVRPSCSFASSNRCLKPEPCVAVSPENDIFPSIGNASHSSDSRTPTPRAESTTTTTVSTDRPPQAGSATPDIECPANSSSLSQAGDEFDSFLAEASVISLPDVTDVSESEPKKDAGRAGQSNGGGGGKDMAKPSGKDIEVKLPEHSADDPSEDWCAVCHNGGDLLCCDSCPKVFHLNCHVPSLPKAPSSSEDWFCGLCTKSSDIMISSPLPRPDDASDQLLPQEIKVCQHLLLELFTHEDSTPFHEPVGSNVPNYYKIISAPMDLGTVKEKLESKKYNKLEDFFKDLQLIFSNCATYNLQKSTVGVMGSKLEKFFHSRLKLYVPYIDQSSLLPSDDSLDTETDIPESASPVLPPPRKKKRTRSHNINDDNDDDDWTVESTDDSTDDTRELKRKFKRKHDSCSSGSESASELPVVHVH